MEQQLQVAEQGLTRRDLMRRGAIVGGSLMWAAPTVQSFAKPAFAQDGTPVIVEGCPGFVTGGPNLVLTTDGGQLITLGLGPIQCDASQPTEIEINFDGSSAHFTALVDVRCCNDPAIDAAPPPACFDTITGIATGTFNPAVGDTVGATLVFTFTDAGEPGTADTGSIEITADGLGVVLDVSGTITAGDIQAHSPPGEPCPNCPC